MDAQAGQNNNINRNSVHVIIKDKNGTIFDGNAKAVSSYNAGGIFDVLPLHTHFISLIQNKVTVHKDGAEEKNINIGTGLMKVSDNQINIYLGLPEIDQNKSGSKEK